MTAPRRQPDRRSSGLRERARHVAVGALVLLAVACQPSGVPGGAASPQSVSASESESRLGAPSAGGVPESLDGLLARTEPEARRWQDEPRLVQVTVGLTGQTMWAGAQATYMAADADRLLTLELTGDGLSQQLVSLSTLQLQPVTDAGLQELPALPDDVLAPERLRDACAADAEAVEVAYTTGAPATWDGTAWTVPPAWTALVTTPVGATAVDPTSGECEEEP